MPRRTAHTGRGKGASKIPVEMHDKERPFAEVADHLNGQLNRPQAPRTGNRAAVIALMLAS